MFGRRFPYPSYSFTLESYLGSCNLFPILLIFFLYVTVGLSSQSHVI